METTVKILNKIENVLFQKANKLNHLIVDEDLGVIIFFATMFRNTGNEDYKEKALELFNKTVADFSNHELNYSLVHGFEGVFWTVNYLYESGILENENVLANLEPHLIESIEYDLKNHNYNILHGALGKIQYFLYSKSVDQQKASVIIKTVLQSLYENRIEENGGLNWNDFNLKDGVNIGYFNGHPTVLKYLLKIKELGYQGTHIDEMIDKLINILLASQIDSDRSVSIRGKEIKEGEQYYGVLGLHGDLTVAYSLYYAGMILGREDLKEKAFKKAIEISSKNPKTSGIMYFEKHNFQDIGMSHGLGGITYLLFKLNHWIQDPQLERNLQVWQQEFLENTNKLLNVEEKILMPEIFQKDENEYPYDKFSLMDGILGSGFVLSSLFYKKDNWGNYLTMY